MNVPVDPASLFWKGATVWGSSDESHVLLVIIDGIENERHYDVLGLRYLTFAVSDKVIVTWK